MQTYDLSPLFRHSVGFDRMNRLLQAASSVQDKVYPPYNILRTGDDAYRITIAVAGFDEADLEIVLHQNVLTVKGAGRPLEDESVTYLHRGIAERAFERRFTLADHIQVVGARSDKGLLHIDLRKEVPEELKPRTIQIQRTDTVPAEAK